MEKQSQPPVQKPFWDHVADLQRLLLFLVSVFLLSAIVIHYFHKEIIALLLAPLGENPAPLQFLTPLDPLFFILKIDFVGALVIVTPLAIAGLYQFINPHAWYRTIGPILTILTTSVLAILGASYAYFVIIPIVLSFMNSLVVPGTVAAFTATGFVNFVLATGFLLILIFQIPVVTVIGSTVGLFNPNNFSRHRRNIYLAILVATAVITPTTDVLTLLLVCLPAVVVTEVGVMVGKFLYKEKT